MKSKMGRNRLKRTKVHKRAIMNRAGREILARVLASILVVVVGFTSVPMDGLQVYAEEQEDEYSVISESTIEESGQQSSGREGNIEESDGDVPENEEDVVSETDNEMESEELSEIPNEEEYISEDVLFSALSNAYSLESQGEISIKNEADWAAGFSRGSGTTDDPYIIITVEQLQFFNQNYYKWQSAKNKYYALQSNINYAGKEWTPIDTVKGFDGNGYTIGNVKIVADDDMGLNQSSNIAMFNSVETLTDLKIDGAQIIDNRTSIGNSYIHYAVLCASNSRSSMTGCTVKGDIKLTINGSYSGTPSLSGLVGVNNGEIDDCIFSGTFFIWAILVALHIKIIIPLVIVSIGEQ